MKRSIALIGMLGAAVMLLARAAQAGPIEIQFTGLDVVYDGLNVDDAGVPVPIGADALSSMDFFDNHVLVGSLGADIFADIGLLGVHEIPVGGGVVNAAGGVFDLLTALGDLELDLDSFQLTYSGGQLFGEGLGSIFGQALPFGLVFDSPVHVSFALGLANVTHNGTFLTGFTGSGVGAVPEPAALLLCGTAIAALAVRRLRRSRSQVS